MRHTVTLFMWAYQPHFRKSIEYLACDVLKLLGVAADATVLLVGLRRPGSNNSNVVCVEPEDGKWPLALFDDIGNSVESIYSKHHLQGVAYSDDASNRDKPKRMRREAVTSAVMQALEHFDVEHGVRSFCGMSWLVDDYFVVPVIQVPEAVFRKFPPLNERPSTHEFVSMGYRSVIHAALATVLNEASTALQNPEPGRPSSNGMRRSDEVVHRAAEKFMRTPGLAVSDNHVSSDLFSRLNLVSSLLYEGAQGVGRLLLTDPASARIQFHLYFLKPVPIAEPRWARKVLQLAGPNAALISDCHYVYGVGELVSFGGPDDQSVFTVNFLDYYSWELMCGDIALLRSTYGTPTLPIGILEEDAFVSCLERLFPMSTESNRSHIWQLFNVAAHQKKGSMIVIADDAELEAERLASQGMNVQPVKLSIELFRQVSSVDGSILLDPQANCHAFGVILDGVANAECSPARGSRFNSAVRYVRSGAAKRLAIVVSDDRTVDVFPPVRARQSRKELIACIEIFAKATVDNYHTSMNWLYEHRFYLDSQQCAQINAKLEQLRVEPKEVGEIRYLRDCFNVDPDFNLNYMMD